MHIVSIIKCSDYSEDMIQSALNEAIAPLGGWDHFIHPEQRILLKPNFIRALPPERQAITHPRLLSALAQIIRTRNARAFIGDSPAFGSLRSVLSLPALRVLRDDPSIAFLPFKKGKRQNFVRSGFKKIPIADDFFSCDTVINIPKLKTHGQLRLSGAAKNMFGLVCGRWKAYQHFKARGNLERFALFLAELAHIFPPTLTIVDGIIGMERTGPSGGEPYPYNVIIAGTNVFAVDLVIANLFNLAWHDVPILKTAVKAGYIDSDIDKIKVSGNIEAAKEQFRKARVPHDLSPISFDIPRLIKGFIHHLREKRTPPPPA